jgi:hypothetical protein
MLGSSTACGMGLSVRTWLIKLDFAGQPDSTDNNEAAYRSSI